MERRKPKRITLLNDSFSPLSERQIVDATIGFMNGAELTINGLWAREINGKQLRGDEYLADRISLHGELKEVALATRRENASSRGPDVASVTEYKRILRARAGSTVSLSFTDPVAAAKVILDGQLIEGLTYNSWDANYSLGPSPKGLRLTHEFRFTTVSDLVELGLALLLDESRGFREKLCQCQWKLCGFFFFEVKPATGRPQRKYCSAEHMLKAHDQKAAKRMRDFREKPKPTRKHK